MPGVSVAKKAFSRLPQALRPKHYSVRLKPDLDKFTFQGWMLVNLEVKEQTKKIVLNAAELSFQRLALVQQDSKALKDLTDFQVSEEEETLTVSLAEDLHAGSEANLLCVYTGTLNDQMRGFYRSRYTPAEGGEGKHCAVTQFEATDARRCFPCFDEPACKATFAVSVIAPEDRNVYSNTPELAISDQQTDDDAVLAELAQVDEGQKLVRFGKTPIMSTYLGAT